MTDQPEVDRLLGAFFVEGTDELADRVIDAALDQIDHTQQRRAFRMPRRFSTMTTPIRLAAAAVVGVLAVGGTLYMIQPGQTAVGLPSPTPGVSSGPSEPTKTPSPTPTPASSPIGQMTVGRQIHTTTLLADGRVLVAGGYASTDAVLTSADLYDSQADAFSPTGSLAAGRGLHTATLLSDGRVLIAGGGPAGWVVAGPYLASAELFDPNTGTFGPTGSMATTREDHTATLLSDGRVLITGGTIGKSSLATAELYDPKTDTFSPTGSMATARSFHTATRLSDGRVLITGGEPVAWSIPFLASAELYDPKTGTFSPTGSMADGRAWHTATLLSDGRVLITGGPVSSTESLASAEIYDPKTGTFSPTGSMTDARTYQTATSLPDGRVLITGGTANGVSYAAGPFLATAELYDPKTGTFSPTGSMTDKRVYHGASVLADGRVLVTDGHDGVAPLRSAEIYDPAIGTFRPAGGR